MYIHLKTNHTFLNKVKQCGNTTRYHEAKSIPALAI